MALRLAQGAPEPPPRLLGWCLLVPIQARLANGHLHMTRHVANTPPTPYVGVVSFAHRRSVRDGGNENVVRLIDGWSIRKVPLANLEFSEFERLIVRSQNELGTSVLLILGWIAASDGSVDRSEVKQLSEISIASKHGPSVEALLELLKKRDTSAIQLAAEIVSRHFRGEKAKLFLEMAIGMAIADRFLRPSENHILRFLADLLGVSKVELNEIFKGVTGRAIPDPGDLSSATYWRRQESAGQRSEAEGRTSSEGPGRPSPTSRAIAAYAILGLENGASQEEITKAYRRLAQIHHPDRFSSLGKESVAAATSTFQRINEAYTYLLKYA